MKKYLILSLFCVVSPFVSVDAMDEARELDRQSMIRELKDFQTMHPELKKIVAEDQRKHADLEKEKADLEVNWEKLTYIKEVHSDLSDRLEGLQLGSLSSNFKRDLDEFLGGRDEEEEDKAVVSRERLLSTALSIDLYKCMFDLMRKGFTPTVKEQVNALLGHAGSLLDGSAYRASSQVGWLEKQLNDVRTAKAKLQIELDDAQAALEQQSTANAELQEQFRDKSDANVGLRSQLEAAKAALEKESNANNANDDLQEQLEAAQAELEQQRTENTGLRSQFEAANAELQKQLGDANAKLEKQLAAKAALEQQLGDAQAELEQQSTENAKLKKQLEDAQAELKKKSNANAELEQQSTENAKLKKQLGDAQAALEKESNANAELRSQFEAANAKLKEQLDDANAKLEQQSNANAALEQQLEAANVELQKQRAKNAELAKTVKSWEQHDDELRKKLIAMTEILRQQELNIDQFYGDAVGLPKHLEAIISELRTQGAKKPELQQHLASLASFASLIERMQQLTGQQIAAGIDAINTIASESSDEDAA